MTKYIKEKAITVPENNIIKIVLLFLIFACFIFYVYFASSAVRIVTAMEKVKEEYQSASVVVSQLESDRLLLESKLSVERAKSMGFVEVNNKKFIEYKVSRSLSLKTQ